MWLLILEALAALALLGGAVWWTMFSGRRKDADDAAETAEAAEAAEKAEKGGPERRPDQRSDSDKP